jgi:hypothetical protein
MPRIVRAAIGIITILSGSALLLRAVQVLVQMGWPQGMKAVAYVTLLPLLSLLPISYGLNLMRRAISWPLFTSGWLIGWGALFLATLLWVLPQLVRIYRLDFLFVAVLASGPAAIVIGILLLVGSER